MSKRILYLSVHEILEYDELRLFTELGYECYSLGAYTQPGGDEHRKRPALKLPYDPHFIELSLQYDRRKLHPEMLKGVDIVIIMHEPSFIGPGGHDWNADLEQGNWPLFKEFIDNGGRVIWRSIGQSIPRVERQIKAYKDEGLEIVRYSPAEQTIRDFAGADAVIRFYKDPDEYSGWTGKDPVAVNFTQSLGSPTRRAFTGYDLITKVFKNVPGSKVYGPGNEDLGTLNGGLVSYEKQMEVLRSARAFLYHGTYPASYTLSFIEAWMMGLPIVAVGKQRGNSYEKFPEQDTYEVDSLIDHEKTGYITDDEKMVEYYIKRMVADIGIAKQISEHARQSAINIFGIETIKNQWREFLKNGRD